MSVRTCVCTCVCWALQGRWRCAVLCAGGGVPALCLIPARSLHHTMRLTAVAHLHQALISATLQSRKLHTATTLRTGPHVQQDHTDDKAASLFHYTLAPMYNRTPQTKRPPRCFTTSGLLHAFFSLFAPFFCVMTVTCSNGTGDYLPWKKMACCKE